MTTNTPYLNSALNAVIFDLSGTLINSQHFGDTEVLNKISLKYSGKQYADLKKNKDAGKSLRHNFSIYFGSSATQVYEEYIEELTSVIPCSRLFDGAIDTLNFLKEYDTKLAVISNRPEQYLNDVLAYHKIDHLFTSLISGDTLTGFEKPDKQVVHRALAELEISQISHHTIAMIGDTYVDVKCADNAGVLPILFSGRELHSPEILKRLSDLTKLPLTTVSDYHELKRYFQTLCSNTPKEFTK